MEIAIIAVLAVGVVAAYVVGIRRGRSQAQVVFNRYIHDTVLQALEAMALRRPTDSADLAEFRNIARAQATALRRGIEEPRGGRLVDDLNVLTADLAREGLRATLVSADVDDMLPDARRIAVRDATREALRNTLKHGGTKQVTVRVEERDGGIAVTTRDHGVGFDMAERPRGFGIKESIIARVGQVGGHADVVSKPGGGTRVTIWVPR
ncbi:sensor histidine kinase [Actinocrispum wychmicini]|uniref:Histidine kinase/DNA gyrase B/HSP90-like ATPase n=1 Tax=Actinocrispum wychmicini TaxID=1213861 RepID=A0A4R2JYJ3_9PSEU|nr:ATP-binding protein [Actinocrispum wychmicini]TCO62466.1 histidine kinase/DNA gyrase B/HSP90-like ATPase [Actinocrispum wychmicini]